MVPLYINIFNHWSNLKPPSQNAPLQNIYVNQSPEYTLFLSSSALTKKIYTLVSAQPFDMILSPLCLSHHTSIILMVC